MGVNEYLREMSRLGYPRPSIDFWVDHDGNLKGAASYYGGGRIGEERAYRQHEVNRLIQALFNNITKNGRRFSRASRPSQDGGRDGE